PKLYPRLFEFFDSIAKMLSGFFMSINIGNMEKPKCAKIFWQMQKQFQLTTMVSKSSDFIVGLRVGAPYYYYYYRYDKFSGLTIMLRIWNRIHVRKNIMWYHN